MNIPNHFRSLLIYLGLLPILVSCSSPYYKARPPQPTAFLSGAPVLQDQRGKGPFASSGGSLGSAATQIYIAPVTLDYLCESAALGKPTRKPSVEQQQMAAQLAPVLRQEFVAAFARSPSSRYRVALQPSSDSLILQLALTEVRTSGFVAGFTRLSLSLVGFPEGVIPAAGRMLKPCIAIEGRLMDPTSGVIIYQFADREESPHATIPVRDLFSSQSHARTTIRCWALQFEELTRNGAPRNRDSSAWSIF